MLATESRKHVRREMSLTALSELVDSVQHKHVAVRSSFITTGLPQPLDQLSCGTLHEWFSPRDGRAWVAPLLVLTHLARRCSCASQENRGGFVVWIGHRWWSQPQTLLGGTSDAERGLLNRSLFVNPSSARDRLWAIDVCLRSQAVSAVVADGSQFRLSHSRRVQLAAEAGNALALLARPVQEITMPSAAATRWRVEHVVSSSFQPRWTIELLRCKGVQRWSGKEARTTLMVEHDRATNGLRLPSELADRSIHKVAKALRRAS